MQRVEFVALMSQMRACYPQALKDPAMWEATTRAYWEALRCFDREVIRATMSVALSRHPQWFPTAPQLAEIARERARSRAVRENADETRQAFPVSKEAGPYVSGEPPHSRDQYKAYIKAGKTPFERLARMWECETKSLGLTSDSTTPLEVGKRRWLDFWKTWGKVGA